MSKQTHFFKERHWEAISAMQKCIRRGLEAEAGGFFFELEQAGLFAWAVSRLHVCAHEDIGTADVQAVMFAELALDRAVEWHKKKEWGLAARGRQRNPRTRPREKKPGVGSLSGCRPRPAGGGASGSAGFRAGQTYAPRQTDGPGSGAFPEGGRRSVASAGTGQVRGRGVQVLGSRHIGRKVANR